MQKIDGLTYDHLGAALREKGFAEVIDERGRTYTHPSKARLLLPPVAGDESVLPHHFVAARGMVDDFGIMTRDAFELLLLRVAHKTEAAV